MGQRTEERSDREISRKRVDSLRTAHVENQSVWLGTRQGLVSSQAQSISHLLRHRSQKLGPSGVRDGEFVGIYFECAHDAGLRPSTKWSLGGGGLDKLSVAFSQRKADRADPVDV